MGGPAVGSGAATSAIDEYGAPEAPVISTASDPVSAIDEYGAPEAPVISSGSSSPAVSAGDDYGAPIAPVVTSNDVPEVSPELSLTAPDEPTIQDNGFSPSTDVEAAVNVGDSYGSPYEPAPSSYDAPAVPAGNA